MNFIKNDHLGQNLAFNYIEEYEEIHYFEYKDETFRYIQSAKKMPDVDAIIEMADIIYKINPLLIYNVGAESLLSDYCTYFTTTACLPCSNEFPVTCSKYLLVGRMLEERDQDRINHLYDYQQVIETNINYQYPKDNTAYTREGFGISETCFLMGIIGNRLDSELTEPFV